MASDFGYTNGILLINYFEKKGTSNSQYICNLLNRLNGKLDEKRSGLTKKKIIFHYDNSPAHQSVLAMNLEYDFL